MPVAKLDYNRIWASSGDPADTVDPGNTYLLGWTAVIPPHEFFNFIEQDFSLKFKYWNENGIPEWDAVSEFKSGSLVTGGTFDGGIFLSKTDGVTIAPPEIGDEYGDRVQNDDWVAYPSYLLSDNSTEPYAIPLNLALFNLIDEAKTSPVQPIRTFEQTVAIGAATEFDNQLQLPYMDAGTYSVELFLVHNSHFNGADVKSQMAVRGYDRLGTDQAFDMVGTYKDSALVPFGGTVAEEQLTETLVALNQIGTSFDLGASDITQALDRSFRFQGVVTLNTPTQLRLEYEQMPNRNYTISRGSYFRAELVRRTLPIIPTQYLLEDDTIWSDTQMTWNSVDGRWERPPTGPAISVLSSIVDFTGFDPAHAYFVVQIPNISQNTWVQIRVKDSLGTVMHYQTQMFSVGDDVQTYVINLPDLYSVGATLGDIEIESEVVDTQLQVNTIAFDKRYSVSGGGLPPVLPPVSDPTDWGPMLAGANSGATFGNGNAIASDKSGGGVWVALFDQGWASRTDDDGVSWSPLVQGLNSGSSTEGGKAVASDGAGVWVAVIGNPSGSFASRSVDNGITWAPVDITPVTNPYRNADGLETDGNGTWVMCFDDGYALRSIDNGITWVELVKGLNSGNTDATFYDLATDKNGVWVIGAAQGWASRSTDNGATWSPLTPGLNSGMVTNIISIDTDGDGTWVAGFFDSWASISQDNGITWFPLVRGLNSGNTRHIQTLSALPDGTWVAGMHGGYASYSTDSAVTWLPAPFELNSGSTFDIIWSVDGDPVTGIRMSNQGDLFMSRSPELPPPPPPAYQQAVLADGPIALFMLQDTDTGALDETGTFPSAESSVIPSAGSQIEGYSKSLTLTGNSYFFSNNSEGVVHTWPFWAIEFWYTPSASADPDRIIQFYDPGTNGNNLSFRVGRRGDGAPYFEIRDSGVVTSTFDGPTGVFVNGNTYHVVMQGKFDQGSPYEYLFELYVDAQTKMSIIEDVASPDIPPSIMAVLVQANFDNSPPDIVSTISGLSIWDKMLTPTEVILHYMAGQP